MSQAGTTITASFASGTGTLTNATATTSGAGLATFAGLAITGTVGSYTLQYDAGALTGVSSNPITLNPGPANHVTITVQPPPTASSGVALSTQPVVQLRDGQEMRFPREGLRLRPPSPQALAARSAIPSRRPTQLARQPSVASR